MGNNRAFIVACLFSAMLLQGARDSAAPSIIPIQNASFENVAFSGPGECGLENRSSVPGWQFQGGGGVLQPSSPPPSGCWTITPPEGANVAFAGYGGSFSQDTGVTPASLQASTLDGIYTMRFLVAAYLGPYPGYYEATISFVGSTGTQELCSTDGWAQWHFVEVPLVCPSPRYLVYGKIFPEGGGSTQPTDPNAHIVISFSTNGWPVLFDNISLTFTPTPN